MSRGSGEPLTEPIPTGIHPDHPGDVATALPAPDVPSASNDIPLTLPGITPPPQSAMGTTVPTALPPLHQGLGGAPRISAPAPGADESHVAPVQEISSPRGTRTEPAPSPEASPQPDRPGYATTHTTPRQTAHPTPSAPETERPAYTSAPAFDAHTAQLNFTSPRYSAPQGFPAPPGPGAHQHERTPLGWKAWAGAVAAGVVVAGGAVAVVVSGGGEEDAPAMVSALTASEASLSRRSTSVQAGPPVVPGYQVVVAPDNGAAYDVPAGWTVAEPGTPGGFGTPPDAVSGKGYAFEGKDYCPGSTRTVAFVTSSQNTDTSGAATELATRTARAAYADSTGGGPTGAPQPLASLDGAQNGTFVESKGAIPASQPGCATEYTIYTFAAPADTGTVVLVIAADTGVPGAVDTEIAKRIFRTIRPHEG
ncbi:hypothetical protein DFR74_11719 [Nocardia puris]|uniref:DUF8017 domain-containing protein n=1 Tax=Nocardia puris TaxID=208602 RepID=A0A366D2D4_9NOCA|nr:hypothetical protein DFR74_11719 [Nocardia puris]